MIKKFCERVTSLFVLLRISIVVNLLQTKLIQPVILFYDQYQAKYNIDYDENTVIYNLICHVIYNIICNAIYDVICNVICKVIYNVIYILSCNLHVIYNVICNIICNVITVFCKSFIAAHHFCS